MSLRPPWLRNYKDGWDFHSCLIVICLVFSCHCSNEYEDSKILAYHFAFSFYRVVIYCPPLSIIYPFLVFFLLFYYGMGMGETNGVLARVCWKRSEFAHVMDI